jgi:hypothetical protein
MNEKMSDMTVVATFNDAEKSQPVKDRLEKEGIHAATFDESRLQRFWFLCRPLANHRVCVREEDANKARQFLKTTGDLLRGQVCCLQCGSPRVEYPQFTRKFISTTAAELFCILGLMDRKFYCLDCHHTWPPAQQLRRRTDALNWPDRQDPHLVEKE